MAQAIIFRYFSVKHPSCEHDCSTPEEVTEPTSGNFLITNTGNFLITNTGDFLIAS